MLKRFFDFVIALVGLVCLSPIFFSVAILIYLRMGLPIFFKQLRPGKNEEPFYIYKFRTMSNERDEKGSLLPNSERITPLGSFLRRFSIDELPELFNVLKGEMSLVGPRPLKMEYLKLYNKEQRTRHKVRPGITGWAQVNGRNKISWADKFELDIWYVENHNLWIDLKILFRTFSKVFRREGINYSSNETMPKFEGTDSKPE